MPTELWLAFATAAASSFAAVGCLGWWLSTQFRNVELKAAQVAEQLALKAEETMERHEIIDQRRHEEARDNTQKIFIALTQLGWRNGPTKD